MVDGSTQKVPPPRIGKRAGEAGSGSPEPIDRRPSSTTQSAAFLARLRENLRGRLFGTTEIPVDPNATRIEAGARIDDANLPSHIGRYEVIGRIGSGGMGVIYSAFDRDLGRKVAVKLLNPRGTQGEEARQRLLREAKALAKLSHPAIVHVYEVGTFETQVYVAMEFVQGMTLRQWQSVADRSWRSVLAAYSAAASGLAAGHAAGIVHRDFKPDNVLVRDDGEVRVIDFGLARTQAEAVPLHDAIAPTKLDGDIALTKTGTLMGTPAYMGPEQYKGDTADARTDQFSFCVALYEALYGYRPFAGTTIHQLATNVLKGNVEAPPRYTDVPERVYRVLLRGLEVDPVERYDSMQQLLGELPSDAPRVLPWVAGGLGVLLVAAAVGGWGYTRFVEAQAQARIDEVRADYVESRGADAESALRRSWGRTREHRYNGLVLRTAESLVQPDPTEALATLKRLDLSESEWLPPARLLAAEAEAREVVARTLSLAAGPVRHLDVDATASRVVIGAGRLGVYTHPAPGDPGGRMRAPSPLRGGDFEVADLDMSDDGQLIVAGGKDGVVRVWNGPNSEPKTWVRRRESISAVAVAANGSRIAVGTAYGSVLLGTPKLGPQAGSFEHQGAVNSVAVSADGAVVASAGADKQIRVSFIDQRKGWKFAHRGGVQVAQLEFSRDGLVLDALGVDGWVWRLKTDDRKGAILPRPSGITSWAQSSTGAAIAVHGPGQPLRVYADSEAPARELDSRGVTALAMSGDESTVVSAGLDNTIRYWKVRREADPVYDLGETLVLSLAHDAISGRLAIGGSGGLVRVWDADGEEWRSTGQLMGGVHAVTFSPDGRRLAGLGGLGGITVWTLDSQTDPLSLLPASFEGPIRWSTDGTRLAATTCDSPRRCGLIVHDIERDERLLSTPLGRPLRAFSLSSAARFAVVVRRSSADVLELHDLQSEGMRQVPWPENDRPHRIVAHAFGPSAAYLRIATLDEQRLRLWHWEPQEDVLALLDESTVDSVKGDANGSALLLRGADGDDLWVLGETLRRPIGPLPERVDYFEVAADAETILVVSDGRATVIHKSSGVRRTISGLARPYVWRGLSAFATVEHQTAVRLLRDPTPDAPGPFTKWLGDVTDAEPKTGLASGG